MMIKIIVSMPFLNLNVIFSVKFKSSIVDFFFYLSTAELTKFDQIDCILACKHHAAKHNLPEIGHIRPCCSDCSGCMIFCCYTTLAMVANPVRINISW